MKKSLFSITLALLIAQPTFATITHLQPACPSLDAIKSVGFSGVSRDSTWGWIAITNDTYDTSATWSVTLFIGGTPQTESEAMSKVATDLVSLTSVMGPIENTDSHQWACYYMGFSDAALAVSFTPVLSNSLS
jgi:hypothetical protein